MVLAAVVDQAATTRLDLAVPFIVAAAITLLGVALTGPLNTKVTSAIDDIVTAFETAASGKKMNLATAHRDHLARIAAWTADAASAFPSIAGFVAAAILIFREDTGNVLPLFLLAAAFLVLLVLMRVLLKAPQDYPTRSPSWFQLSLVAANVLMAVGLLVT